MKPQQKPKKTLLKDGKHQLLSLKDILDQVLREGQALPKECKDSIVQARNTAWESFVKEQERINATTQ